MTERAATAPDAGARLRNATGALRRHPWLTALGVLVLAIVILVLVWDWNWFKHPLERYVQARTGRAFRIGGDLDVDLGRTVVVRADRVRFANAGWSKQHDMASADRIEAGIRAWPLLRRDVVVPDIRLSKPDLRLEKGPRGAGNWDFLPKDRAPSRWDMRFQRLWIKDGRLQFIDPAKKTDIDVTVDSLAQDKPGAAPPIAVEGDGHWKGNRFTLRGRAESPLDLRDTDSPYTIDAHAPSWRRPARAHRCDRGFRCRAGRAGIRRGHAG
jgi:uncharacterized protein involved in outer membrane biogenesis